MAAVSGLLGSQWSHRNGGVYLVLPIASYGAAFVASSSISAALFEREGSGRGQKIEVSWLAGAFAMQSGTILYHPELLRLFSGRLNPLGPIPVYRLYKAKDDWLFVACGNTTFWNKFCLALEHPEWTSEPRYEKAPWGIAPEDRDELAERIAAVIAGKPREEWLRILREYDVPSAPVTSRQEFIDHPQTIHNGMRVEVDDPKLGKTVQMGVPVRMYTTPGTIKGPAPLLGPAYRRSQKRGSRVRFQTYPHLFIFFSPSPGGPCSRLCQLHCWHLWPHGAGSAWSYGHQG